MFETKIINTKVIKLRDLAPCQIAKLIDGSYAGEIIMRTANTQALEVMSLSNPEADGYWDDPKLLCEPLQSGTSLTITII